MSRAVLTRCVLLVRDPLLWNVLHHSFSEEHQGLTLFDDLGEKRGKREEGWAVGRGGGAEGRGVGLEREGWGWN